MATPDFEDDSLEAELDRVLKSETSEAETADAEEERLYRRDGRRFVAREAEKAEADTIEPKLGEAQTTVAKPEQPAAKPWRPTWYKDEYGAWDKLPDNFRTALREQERNASVAIERHSTSAKAWEPVQEALAPHLQELAASGVSPQQYVGNLINADKYLRESPVEAINWIAQSYLGVDLQGLADWMAEQNYQPAKIDPVQQKIQALEAKLSAFENQGHAQQRAVLDKQITDWSRDKPDFAAVRADMAALAKRYPEASLDDLYERARWAHPETRDSILKEKEDKRLAELKRARAAGATSPRGAQTNAASRTKPTMTLEDEIAMHLDGGV